MQNILSSRIIRGLLVLGIALVEAWTAPAAYATTRPVPGQLLPWQRGWKNFDGKYLRLDGTGAFSCYSLDGQTCSRASPVAWRADYHPSLECRADGPDGAWCERAYAGTFARWFNYEALGHNVRLAKSLRGHTMCESYDAQNCDWNVGGDEPTLLAMIRPLVCGAEHRAVTGISGYDTPGHWCATPEIVQRDRDVPLQAGATVPVDDLPSWVGRDYPGWIVRANVPQGGELTIEAPAVGRPVDPAELPRQSDFTAGYTVGTATSGPFFKLSSGRVLRAMSAISPPSPQGALTVAVRVGVAGDLCFQHMAGVTGNVLDSISISDGWDVFNRTLSPALSAISSREGGAGQVQVPRLRLRSTEGVSVTEVITITAREVPRSGDGSDNHSGLSVAVRCPGIY